jgi:hypothetical protein
MATPYDDQIRALIEAVTPAKLGLHQQCRWAEFLCRELPAEAPQVAKRLFPEIAAQALAAAAPQVGPIGELPADGLALPDRIRRIRALAIWAELGSAT